MHGGAFLSKSVGLRRPATARSPTDPGHRRDALHPCSFKERARVGNNHLPDVNRARGSPNRPSAEPTRPGRPLQDQLVNQPKLVAHQWAVAERVGVWQTHASVEAVEEQAQRVPLLQQLIELREAQGARLERSTRHSRDAWTSWYISTATVSSCQRLPPTGPGIEASNCSVRSPSIRRTP